MAKIEPNFKIEFNLENLMWEKRIPSINYLSEQTDITRQTLIRMKKNEAAGIHFKTIETLCSYLKCELTDLLVKKEIEG